MEIESIKHKALQGFAETGKSAGIIQPKRLTNMLAFIANAGSFDELRTPPNFGFHALKGDRKGTYAMTVTKNWRLTFTKLDDRRVGELDLEDYH